ncbi:hypothetical protein [Mycobacterium sp. 29Ha]|uniref:hypothetical protein n=1 Tax=Mycobacterium sp. 29Ha TaxID=2939268 RepID=UPI002938F337|nr:hypothetical protein [Mycobacterium sp. 29Ha]MDV3135419.1 hypothetical protein [Mycobacterium sp. 29Ha]
MTATSPPATATHPRTHSVEFWRARLGAMASRGETDGPRVDEARAALSWLRRRASLMKTLDISEERAESLMDVIAEDPDTEAVAR